MQACFWAFFLSVEKNLHRRRPLPRNRIAGHAWSRAIAGAAFPHQLLCMVEPNLPCVCAGILTFRVFWRSFLAGPQITCIDWHDTMYAARGGVVSSAFAGGHQLQRTQGTGVPAATERACENSDLRRLADPLAAVRRCTSGYRAGGKALRRGPPVRFAYKRRLAGTRRTCTVCATVRSASVFCSSAQRALPSFVCLRVHNPPGLPLGMMVHHQHSRLFPLWCSLLRPLLLLQTIC